MKRFSSQSAFEPLPGYSNIATALLFILILIIGIGPRISLGFVDAEIRVQDLLIIPLMLYLVLTRTPATKMPVQRLLGLALPIFVGASMITVAISVFVFPDVALLRRITFYGRTVEMIFLAIVVAGLYLRAGHKALKSVLSAVTVGAVLNLAWFGYQLATGAPQTLVGQQVSDQIESYGPKLIGEPSAFGTGQYWAFVAAVAAARIKTGNRTGLNILLFVGAVAGAWLAESRISVGSSLLILAVILVLGKDRRRRINVVGTLAGLSIGLLGLVQIVPMLAGRVSPDSIQEGFDFRVDNIWAPFLDTIFTSPLVGVGPGGLLGDTYLSEAHNIFLRAMLDFGVIVGLLFIALFILAMVRGFRLAQSVGVDQATGLAGYIGAFCVLSTLISGQVQDALTAVVPAHLTMVAIGILAAQRALWFSTQEMHRELTGNWVRAHYRPR